MMNPGTKVLIVDEGRESRAALRRELMGTATNIVGEAGAGPEAFNLAREAQPDVIVASMEEPLVRALKTVETLATNLPGTPIVVVSSLSSQTNMRKAMVAGAADFLSKPLQPGELEAAIETVLKQEEKRRFSRNLSANDSIEVGSIITVFGPKGGIGKTTLAINLAISVANAKHKVVLIDLDTQVGAAAMMLNLKPQKSILDLSQDLQQMDTELLKSYMTYHSSGLHVLAAPLNLIQPEENIQPAVLTRILDLVASTYEYVIIDTPPTTNELVMTALQSSTYILMLTSLEVASICVAKKHLEMMKSWDFVRDKVKIIMNVANSANSLDKTDIADTLGLPVFWKIPHDANVGLASQMGQPLIEVNPKSKAIQSISDMHYALIGLKPLENNRIKFSLPFGRK